MYCKQAKITLPAWNNIIYRFTEAMTTQLGEGVINVFQDAVNGDIPEMTLLFIIFKSLVYHLIIAVVFEVSFYVMPLSLLDRD